MIDYVHSIFVYESVLISDHLIYCRRVAPQPWPPTPLVKSRLCTMLDTNWTSKSYILKAAVCAKPPLYSPTWWLLLLIVTWRCAAGSNWRVPSLKTTTKHIYGGTFLYWSNMRLSWGGQGTFIGPFQSTYKISQNENLPRIKLNTYIILINTVGHVQLIDANVSLERMKQHSRLQSPCR